MGFYNIVLEGQQAEEYKARKAKEAEEKEKAEAERRERRYGGLKRDDYAHFVGSKANIDDLKKADAAKSEDERDKLEDRYDRHSRDDSRRTQAASAVVNNIHYNKGNRGTDKDQWYIDHDAVNKDMRRHSDRWKASNKYSTLHTQRESGIFESVEFLND